MKIGVKIEGLDAAMAALSGQGKQVRFAAARAITQTAHQVNADLKDELRSNIQGGPTAFTLRAFKVTGARRDNLEATVALRTDTPEGGTTYAKALQHLFTGGRRDFKKLEGWLRGKGLIPDGMMAVPGPRAPLDARGNFRKAPLREMLGILGSQTRNLQAWRRSGKSGQFKAVGFFIARPGDKSGRTPGIWRRITTGSSSVVEPWIMYINPTAYRRQFDLEAIAKKTVAQVFQANFHAALADALKTAK